MIEAYSITGPAKNLLEFARLAREGRRNDHCDVYPRESNRNLFIETARDSGIPLK